MKELRFFLLEGMEEVGDEDLAVLVENSSGDLRVDGGVVFERGGLRILRTKRRAESGRWV